MFFALYNAWQVFTSCQQKPSIRLTANTKVANLDKSMSLLYNLANSDGDHKRGAMAEGMISEQSLDALIAEARRMCQELERREGERHRCQVIGEERLFEIGLGKATETEAEGEHIRSCSDCDRSVRAARRVAQPTT